MRAYPSSDWFLEFPLGSDEQRRMSEAAKSGKHAIVDTLGECTVSEVSEGGEANGRAWVRFQLTPVAKADARH